MSNVYIGINMEFVRHADKPFEWGVEKAAELDYEYIEINTPDIMPSNNPKYSQIQQQLEKILSRKLKETNDNFLPGPEYMAMWNYEWDGKDGPK